MSSDELTEVLGYLLKHAHLGLTTTTNEALAPFGVDGRMVGVLRVLAGSRHTSQQEIANVLGADRTTMVALLDTLEHSGLVARHPHPEDRRRNVVELTRKGRDVFRRAEAAQATAEREFLAVLGARDAQLFRRALRSLVTRHSATPDRSD